MSITASGAEAPKFQKILFISEALNRKKKRNIKQGGWDSPIVLSDIPHSNIIYLKRENEKCSIDEDNKHSETFGANIYKLFNDAFFLGEKGQTGEFSKRKIQEIIDKIKPEIKNEGEIVYPDLKTKEVSILEQQISLIGEKILRDKLHEMLYKCKYSSLELREKKIKIYEEKIKRLQNGEDV